MNVIMALLGHFHRAALILLGFAAFMLLGALVLMLPVCHTGTREITFIDALFTSVSTVSVTGMTLWNLKEDLTLFGQLVILLLMQVGGLGIMTIMATLVIYAGRHVRLQERLLLSDSFNLETPSGMVALVRRIIQMTLFVEFVSGTLLGLYFCREFGPVGMYYGYWHAVSAFCNCGLDLFGTAGFAAYAKEPFVCLVVVSTMLLGGIGFIVLEDIRKKRNWRHLSLNTKLVLTAEVVFTTFGTAVIFGLNVDNPHALGNLPGWEEAVNSFFMAVSSRMGGFATFDVMDLNNGARLLIMLLMFIGAAPVSTGGGIRTTTMMIILLSLGAWIRGKRDVVIYHKRIGDAYISKAFHVFTLSAALTFLTAYLLMVFDTAGGGLEAVLFESVSAFSTVGFTAGMSGRWNDTCKIILILAMFIGRIGVMTLVLTFADRHRDRISYPTENVTIG